MSYRVTSSPFAEMTYKLLCGRWGGVRRWLPPTTTHNPRCRAESATSRFSQRSASQSTWSQILDLALCVTGQCSLREVYDCRAFSSGLLHQSPDFLSIFSNIGGDVALGGGNRDRALAHAIRGFAWSVLGRTQQRISDCTPGPAEVHRHRRMESRPKLGEQRCAPTGFYSARSSVAGSIFTA